MLLVHTSKALQLRMKDERILCKSFVNINGLNVQRLQENSIVYSNAMHRFDAMSQVSPFVSHCTLHRLLAPATYSL